ncbi:hypothetical protein Hanom_Chr14g01309741 [Helianthus anomalus]
MAEEEAVQVEEGPIPVLKWDQGLFEQIVRGYHFAVEWDARYPQQGQKTADTPSGYITLFANFFLKGNFRCNIPKIFIYINYIKLMLLKECIMGKLTNKNIRCFGKRRNHLIIIKKNTLYLNLLCF